LIDPRGKIVLTYRKHNGPNNLNTSYTGPGDVYQRFVKSSAKTRFFPVADTPIGRVGIMVCGDIVSRGDPGAGAESAEIVLHPTAEIYRRSRGWEAMRVGPRRRKQGLSPLLHHRGLLGTDGPSSATAARQIISPDGDMLAIVDGPGEAVISAAVDIDRLRWRKTGRRRQLPLTPLCCAAPTSTRGTRAISWPTSAFRGQTAALDQGLPEIAAEIIARQIGAPAQAERSRQRTDGINFPAASCESSRLNPEEI
jgi:hypothetical protein